MMLNKKQIHTKVITNNIIGVLVGLIVSYVMLPILRDVPAEYASPIFVSIMFIFSYIRGYLVEVYFNWRYLG